MIDLLTPAITIAGGLVVFGATQIAQRFWLDPITELMKALGKASYAAVYYSNVYASPGRVKEELSLESARELRKVASELQSALRSVRSYKLFEVSHQFPPKHHIREIAALLIGLSNVTKEEDTREAWAEGDRLKALLGIKKS